MARSDDVLDDPAHDRVEQQIAKPLPLVEQKPDELLLVAEDALHADLGLGLRLLGQARAQRGRLRPADRVFHDAVAVPVQVRRRRFEDSGSGYGVCRGLHTVSRTTGRSRCQGNPRAGPCRACRRSTVVQRGGESERGHRGGSRGPSGRLRWMANMSDNSRTIAVVIGATSKWQSDGRNTRLVHGGALDDSGLPVGVRWGVGGAVAQKFAAEGYLTVLTTRRAANAAALKAAIDAQGGAATIMELDVVSEGSIARAFATIRRDAGEPDVVVYNAGYIEGRELPPDQELLEYIPTEMFETAQHVASRGPFLVAKEVLPAMRKRGSGSFLLTNNASSLRGRKRFTGQSLYYPRVMMRNLAQVLTEEYSEHGVHVANIVIDGLIDSPGTRALPTAQERPETVINPVKIAEAFYYLHTQDRSCWTHELQLTPSATPPSY